MNYTLQGKLGTFIIPIPTGYTVVPAGESILAGDKVLQGGEYYHPEDFIVKFREFEGLEHGPRTVTSEMLVIRSTK
jgi:hypothetical protein